MLSLRSKLLILEPSLIKILSEILGVPRQTTLIDNILKDDKYKKLKSLVELYPDLDKISEVFGIRFNSYVFNERIEYLSRFLGLYLKVKSNAQRTDPVETYPDSLLFSMFGTNKGYRHIYIEILNRISHGYPSGIRLLSVAMKDPDVGFLLEPFNEREEKSQDLVDLYLKLLSSKKSIIELGYNIEEIKRSDETYNVVKDVIKKLKDYDDILLDEIGEILNYFRVYCSGYLQSVTIEGKDFWSVIRNLETLVGVGFSDPSVYVESFFNDIRVYNGINFDSEKLLDLLSNDPKCYFIIKSINFYFNCVQYVIETKLNKQ